jgi:hypothetical protein
MCWLQLVTCCNTGHVSHVVAAAAAAAALSLQLRILLSTCDQESCFAAKTD